MINFIQQLNDKKIRYIASSDYSDNCDEYYEQLKQVIFQQSCILYPDQEFMPGNVISLCSNDLIPKHGHEFIACNLLLIINRGAFRNIDLHQHKKNLGQKYSQLSEPYSALIEKAYLWAGM